MAKPILSDELRFLLLFLLSIGRWNLSTGISGELKAADDMTLNRCEFS
jgi:hypothetical protein